MQAKRNPTSNPAAPTAIAALIAVVALVSACFGGGSERKPPEGGPSASPETSREPDAMPTATTTPATPGPTLADARAKLDEGRYEDAAAAFDAASQAGSAGDRADALLGAGIAYGRAGAADTATERLRGAVVGAAAGSPTRREAAYLLGRRLNEAGRYTEAAEILAPVVAGGDGGALRPFLEAEQARAIGRAGDREKAEQAWSALLARGGVPASVRELALRERVALAQAADDRAGALALLRELAALTGAASDRYALAEASWEAGDGATFASQLVAIVAGVPASRFAPLAVERLEAEGYAVDPGQEGLVRYRHGDLGATVAVLEPAAAEEALGPFDASFRWFYLGAAYEDLGRLEEAVAAYDRAVAAGGGGLYAHRAAYWAARVTEALGDPAGASERYLAVVRGPGGEFTAESAFRAGYTRLASGDPAGAIASWEALGLTDQARVLYWKGRALEQTGDTAGSRAAYEAAIAAGPLDFYAGEARLRLGEGQPVDVRYRPAPAARGTDWSAVARWVEAAAGPGSIEPAATAASELARLGLTREAATEVLATVVEDDAWSIARAMRAADEANLTSTAAGLAVQLRMALGAQSHDVPAEVLRIAYPLRYVDTIDEAGRSNGLDPLFLAALVRTESYWDADAGSVAGALGLTQVIPVTGEAIASAMGYEGFAPEDLFRPAVSLAFGANYIGGQLHRFGNPYYALAAYNAGPGAAERWVDRAADAPMADFVEAVEYTETRNYVVIAMENYAHYLQAWRGG